MKHTKRANKNISMNKYQALPQGNKIHMLPQNKSKPSPFAAMTITHVILVSDIFTQSNDFQKMHVKKDYTQCLR